MHGDLSLTARHRHGSSFGIVPRQRQRTGTQPVNAGLPSPNSTPILHNQAVMLPYASGLVLQHTCDGGPAQDALDKGRFRLSRTTSLDFKGGAPVAAAHGHVPSTQPAMPGLPGDLPHINAALLCHTTGGTSHSVGARNVHMHIEPQQRHA